jgi:hypothetical protein
MKWDIPERTEDAFVSYLKSKVGGDIRVCAAWERDEPQYPACVVFCGGDGPVSADAEWHDARMLSVQIHVVSEAADELDASGKVIRTVRERNAAARSDVMNALCVTDLPAQLATQGIADVAFSMAQATTTERSVDGAHVVTIINIDVIAEPVTGS